MCCACVYILHVYRYTRVYVCCACVYVYIFCMCIDIYECMCVCCACVYILHVHGYMCVCICACVRVCMCACVHVCVCVMHLCGVCVCTHVFVGEDHLQCWPLPSTLFGQGPLPISAAFLCSGSGPKSILGFSHVQLPGVLAVQAHTAVPSSPWLLGP